jgi:hypothetical protein
MPYNGDVRCALHAARRLPHKKMLIAKGVLGSYFTAEHVRARKRKRILAAPIAAVERQ